MPKEASAHESGQKAQEKTEEKPQAKSQETQQEEAPAYRERREYTPRGKRGIVHLFASHNNTIMLVTDITGAETIAKCSGGQVIKAQHKEGSPYAAMKIAEIAADKAKEKEIFEVDVLVRGPGGNKPASPGPGAEAAIRSLTRNGLRIRKIENVTPLPHDGCRKKKRNRGKRGK